MSRIAGAPEGSWTLTQCHHSLEGLHYPVSLNIVVVWEVLQDVVGGGWSELPFCYRCLCNPDLDKLRTMEQDQEC